MNKQLRQRLSSKYPEWHQQPLRLSVEEIESPHSVVSEFFGWYTLPEIRVCLKQWLDNSLDDNNPASVEHVTLYDNIEKLVEAAWLINKKEQSESNNKQEEQQQPTSEIHKTASTELVINPSDEWKKVNDFFGMLPLTEACNDLWEMTKRALTNPDDETSASERNTTLYLYENTIELYKAAHTLLQQRKELLASTQ